MRNPFVIFGYLSPEYFCDRNSETQRLINAAENGRNTVLASIRRLGKSGLIKHIQNQMTLENKFVTVYMDIMPTTDLVSFTRTFAKSIFEQSAGLTLKSFTIIKSLLTRITPSLTIDPVTNVPSLELKINGNEEAMKTIEDVFNYIRTRNMKFHICIDEFQQISGYSEKNLEAILRSEIQKTNNAVFVFSGSKKHLLMSMFSENSRPFYQSSEFFELQKIPNEEYIKFIIAQFKKGNKQISQSVAELILEHTRTHTYYVQYLCNRLFSGQLSVIEAEDVDSEILNIINENDSIYHSYRSLLTNNQWQLLQSIGKEDFVKEPTSAEFIRNYGLGSASSVSLAVKSLLEKELVYQDINGLYVSDVFFSKWMKYL